MSRDTRVMLGITLLLVPTIVYGGLTVLNIVSGGAYGTPGPPNLTPEQVTFYRAGHAHAGVLMILSLVLQIAIDHARIPRRLAWAARIAAPAAAIAVSGGFFATAHAGALRLLLYIGATLVVAVTVLVGVGLLRGGRLPHEARI
jgi:hypothetical protein